MSTLCPSSSWLCPSTTKDVTQLSQGACGMNPAAATLFSHIPAFYAIQEISAVVVEQLPMSLASPSIFGTE